MANAQTMCTSFLGELFTGTHNFTPSTGDTFKAALYLQSATVDAYTTAYGAAGEVTSTNYTPGGVTITNGNAPAYATASTTAGTGYWTPSASIVYGSAGSPVTFSSFNAVLIYNSSKSNKAVSVHTFTPQTVTSGTFTLTMPSNTTSTALLRLATT